MANTTKSGRTSSIRIRETDLKGDCARLNRRLDLMEQTVVQGAVVSGGGGSSSSGGGGGGGSPTTTPPAPNVVSATVVVEYSCPFNDSMFDLAIAITIPTALLIDELKKIRVHNSLTDTDVLVLAQPDGGWTSPVNATTDLFPQTRADQPGTLTFNSENSNGDTTPLPVAVPFTVKASAVTGFTFAGEVGQRFIDPSDNPTRLLSCMIGFNPTLNGDIAPQSVYFLRSLDDGATWTGIGFQRLEKVGDQILVQSLAPSVDQYWRIAACTGALAASSEAVTAGNIATLFPGIAISDRFLVAALGLPPATLITTLTIAPPTGTGNYPYNAQRADDSEYWKIPSVTVSDQPAAGVPDAFFLRITVQDLDDAHRSVASEHPFAGDQVSPKGATNVYGPLTGEYGTDGITIVRTGDIAYVRFKVYLCNRVDKTEFSFQNPLCATLQTGIGGGQGYIDVLVSAFGGVPPVIGGVIGPVTGVTNAGEVSTRYASDPDRLVHLTIGFTPICPVPQSVTYLVSADNGANWVWIGAQGMLKVGQQLVTDRLAPGADSLWKVACVAGDPGGDPSPIADADLETPYPDVVRSAAFNVAGLALPAGTTGIKATIGACSNVVSADGFTQYGSIPPEVYYDPTADTEAFFVRITVQNLDASRNALTAEQPHGGTQITGPGNKHTEGGLLITYIPNLSFMRYRFYLANRNSKGGGDFADPATNKLQMVSYNGQAIADHYDVPITIPPFTPIGSTDTFNVTSVTASEVGPQYQDEKAGLHTVIGIVPVIDHDYSSPRTVTIWLDIGTGVPVWKGPFALSFQGQVIRLGDKIINAQGVSVNGDVYVPSNPTQRDWIVYCAPGRLDNGIDPHPYKSATFRITPLGPTRPDGTTNAQFLQNPVTHDVIDYAISDPGTWLWEYYCLTFTPPTLAFDPNFWFTLISFQKGGIINGVWTPAPDPEGANADPNLNFLGRPHAEISQLPGVSGGQTSIIKKFGGDPATWGIPPAQNEDLTPNLYRTFRFWLYNVSRLGTDTSGSGGQGTYTLQTSAWPSGADHFDLTPLPKNSSLDFRAANPKTIQAPLTGGNGLPLTIPPFDPSSQTGGFGSNYLADQSVTEAKMAQFAITLANKAVAAGAIVDGNVKDVSITKVTAGTQIFTDDLILSRGTNLPSIDLSNNGIALYGQADANTGATGLLTKPYIVIQNNAIALRQGGTTANPGGSVLVDAANNAITIYTAAGDLTKPYFTVNSTGLALSAGDTIPTKKPYFTVSATALTLVNGVNSFAVNSNAMLFLDTGNKNRIDINSAGVTITNGLKSDGTADPLTASQLVVLSTGLQFTIAGVSQVTINNNTGITLSNGGTASIEITSATITATASSASLAITSSSIALDQGNQHLSLTSGGVIIQAPGANCTVAANQIKMTQAGATVTITSASIKLSNGSSSSVEITPSTVTITNGILSLVDPDYTINIDNTVGIKITATNGMFWQAIGTPVAQGGGISAGVSTSDTTTATVTQSIRGIPNATFGELTLSGVSNGSVANFGTAGTLKIRPAVSTSAGAGSAFLPANPVGFLTALWNGGVIHIPYYT